ncbi:MAG: putrescine aminotransferase [Firmicutes bacterium]|nr:putrescine aminotransferase [Bacillota bacterium]
MRRCDASAVLEETARILSYVEGGRLQPDEAERLTREAAELYEAHVNRAMLEHRKWASSDFRVAEWEDGGAVFYDTRGRRYLDCLGGYGIYTLGHRHPRVVEAVRRQLDKQALHSQELIDPLRAYLAYLLAMVAPGDLAYAYFTNSGAETVEMAIKLARLATGRAGIVAAVNGFHGKTMGALSATGRGTYRQPYLPLVPGFSHVPFGDARAMERHVHGLIAVGEAPAAVLLEPIQGEGGVHVPPDDYLPAVRRLCDETGTLLILDEIQTGMGRTGALFACDHWDVAPDVLCLAKALGGGVMPIGAIVARPHLWKRMEENPFLLGSSTFGGNPLACAAAIAALDVTLREDIPGQARQKGERLLAGLAVLRRRYPEVLLDVRGRGLLIGMEFADDRAGYRVAKGLFDQGILVGGTLNNARVVRIEPPAVIGEEDIDRVLEALERVFAAERAGAAPAGR